MVKRERRAEDNGDDRGYRQRRFFNNGTIVKMLIALLFGSGATGGISFLTNEDHDTITLNKQEVRVLKEKLAGQERLFNAKLETLNSKIDAVDGKIEILLRRTE